MSGKPRTIGFGLVDDEIVFIDLRSDSYFCVGCAQLADLAASVQDRRLLVRGDPALEVLGVGTEPVELVRAKVRRPARSLLDCATQSPARLNDVARIALLLRSTRNRLGRQPIEECLSDLLPDPRLRPIGRCNRAARTERFLRARKLVPLSARDQCLLDSVTLLRWLGDPRSGAALVFGVKLNPFAAHCWVQADDVLLNDRLDNVAAFTPVHAISCSPAMQ